MKVNIEVSRLFYLRLFAAVAYALFGGVQHARADSETSGFTINSSTRAGAQEGYFRHYEPSEGSAQRMAWIGGNLGLNLPGSVSQAYQDDTLRRINYFRAQAGLPADISFNTTKSVKSQWESLILAKHGNLNLTHSPATDWATDPAVIADKAAHGGSGWGNDAASAGNISKGTHGPDAITDFMVDSGTGNISVGHRRWLLYPAAQEMGNGGIPETVSPYTSGGCVWVIGNFKPSSAATTRLITWPNAGYIPFSLVPNIQNTALYTGNQKRWSCSYTGANFASSTVSMTRITGAGSPAAVAVTKEAYLTGFGDNTLTWLINSAASMVPPVGANDISYQVTVSGIVLAGTPPPEFATTNGGATYSYTYTVITFDATYMPHAMALSGPATAPIGLNSTYIVNPLPSATKSRVRAATVSSSAWTEGAETAPAPQIIDGTTAGNFYATLAAAGSKSFHMSFPVLANDQNFTINRDVIPSATSVLQFSNRFRFFSLDSVLTAELSTDAGSSWAPIWTRSGTPGSDSGSSATWETAFQSVSVPIPSAYVGKTVRLRFRISAGQNYFEGTDFNYGVFIDAITITNTQQLAVVSSTELPGTATSYNFSPAVAGTFVLQAQMELGGTHWFDYGPMTTVTSVAALPGSVQNWRNTWLGTATNAGLAGDLADPDGDGLSNLFEYAFGLNPMSSQPGSADFPSLTKSGDNMVFTFKPASTVMGLSYVVQKTSNIQTGVWTTIPTTFANGVYTATVPVTEPNAFLRLQLTNASGL